MDATAAERIVQGLNRVGLALRTAARRTAQDRRLSPLQAQVLALLAQRGPLALPALATALAVAPSTASESVTALVRRGLVVRLPGTSDRRKVSYALTEAGRREAAADVQWPDALLLAATGLSDAEQAALLRMLQRLVARLQQAGAVPLARMCVTCSFFRPNAHPTGPQPHHCVYAGTPLGDLALRFECEDHQDAPEAQRAAAVAELALYPS